MKYPEGENVAVGDIIWTNEGASISRVVEIMETRDAMDRKGLTEPGIMASGDLSGIVHSVVGFEAEGDFEAEGIGLLSFDELLLVRSLAKLLEISLRDDHTQRKPFYYNAARYLIPVKGDGFKIKWFLFLYSSIELTEFDIYLLNSEQLNFEKIDLKRFNEMIN